MDIFEQKAECYGYSSQKILLIGLVFHLFSVALFLSVEISHNIYLNKRLTKLTSGDESEHFQCANRGLKTEKEAY